MSVLITGASGYIGGKLTEKLTMHGETVHALCRHPTKKLLNNPNVVVFKGSITNNQLLKKAINGCDKIYHLASQFNTGSLEEMRNTNLVASKNIFELSIKNNARVVFTSSAGVIGPQEGEALVNEETERRIPFFNFYEQTKFEAEEAARKLFKEKKLDVVIVNPTRVFGPGKLNKGNFLTQIIEKYEKGIWRFIPGDGNAVNNVVYVDDVVEGHLLAMENGKKGERYILGGDNISTNDFFDLLKEISNVDIKMFHISVDMIKNVATMSEYISRLLKREPIVTPQWIERYVKNWGADISKAKNELGYRHTSVAMGLQLTHEWLHIEKRDSKFESLLKLVNAR